MGLSYRPLSDLPTGDTPFKMQTIPKKTTAIIIIGQIIAIKKEIASKAAITNIVMNAALR